MNLFVFQPPGGAGFAVSRQFWVFVLLAVPLTLLTLGSWYLFSRRRKQQKEERRRKQQQEERSQTA
jgi:hypothetical protein